MNEWTRMNASEQRGAWLIGYRKMVKEIWTPVFKKLDKAILESYKKFRK